MDSWFKIESGWTDNHLLLVDVFSSFWVTWKEAEKALELVWLSTNKNMIPYDPRKPLDPSWIRIGTPAATTRGMLETEMKKIASVFTESIKALQQAKWYDSKIEDKSNMEVFEDEKLKTRLNELKGEILELCGEFGVYK